MSKDYNKGPLYECQICGKPAVNELSTSFLQQLSTSPFAIDRRQSHAF